jgi:DNA-binding CsgD family transcriptional regulator
MTPCPKAWGIAAFQALTTSEQNLVELAAQADSDEEWMDRLRRASVFSMQLRVLQSKLAPFLGDAGVEKLDRNGLVEMFVRAGVMHSPSLHQRWREAVAGRVSLREREVLKYVVMGLGNEAVAERLRLSPLTVKTHLARVTSRLEPYASMAYVVHPSNRAGITTIALLAGLDK